MGRRRFLETVGATVLAGLTQAGCSRRPPATPGRSGARITGVSSFYFEAPRWKHVGKNARRADHGQIARDTVVRIETDAGVEGVGPCRASREDAAKLLGHDPLEFYLPGGGVASPLGRRDSPIWDLVGKLLQEPVWRLLGGYGPEWVAVYDSSFYFSDLDPAYASRGVARILEEVDYSLERGHRAFKLKVGRGFQWMEPEAGLQRDVEVVRAVRRHLGPAPHLMVDANDGYDLTTTKRFLEAVDGDLFWIEEPFPEQVDQDLELKAWLRDKGWRTLVADGESVVDPAVYAPFIAARALDVLQGNVHAYGLQQLADLSRLTAPAGMVLAPNNWESFLGFYLELILGRGIPNLLMAEQDPGVTDLVDVTGFELREGRCRVPDTPGCGWQVRMGRLERNAKQNWRVE